MAVFSDDSQSIDQFRTTLRSRCAAATRAASLRDLGSMKLVVAAAEVASVAQSPTFVLHPPMM
ncbi:MAG: hypothetical protein IT427_18485 [Pirellulales bacterium]|nr:hypothetical protein [Pirellulales bacterium]